MSDISFYFEQMLEEVRLTGSHIREAVTKIEQSITNPRIEIDVEEHNVRFKRTIAPLGALDRIANALERAHPGELQ